MRRGEAMKNARVKAGLTREELSMKAGLDRSVVGYLEKETHKGYIDTIELLADALGISIDEYIGREVRNMNEEIRLIFDHESKTYLVYAGHTLLGRAVDLDAVKDIIHFWQEKNE